MSETEAEAKRISSYLGPRYRRYKQRNALLSNGKGEPKYFAFVQESATRKNVFLLVDKGKSGSFEGYRISVEPEEGQTPSDISIDKNLLVEFIKDPSTFKKVEKLKASDTVNLFGLGEEAGELARISAESFYNSLDNPEIATKINIDALSDQEHARFLSAGLNVIRKKVSQESLRALSSSSDFTWGDYTFYSAEGERGEHRRQAAQVYPLLATLFSRRPSLRMAVDRQTSLNDALQNAFVVDDKPMLSKGTLKRIQGVEHHGGNLSPEFILTSLAELPADWVPNSSEEWQAFFTLSETVGSVLKDASGLSLDTLYASSGGKWQNFLRRCARSYVDTRPPEGTDDEAFAYFRKAINWKALEKASPEAVTGLIEKTIGEIDIPEGIGEENVRGWLLDLYNPDCGRESLMNACLDVADMIRHFSDQVVLPLAAKDSGEREIALSNIQIEEALAASASILFSGKAAPNIFETTRQWHNRLADINETISQISAEDEETVTVMEVAEDGWPPLTDAVRAPNGLMIMPLTNPRELADEGRKLDHCVGGYTSNCRLNGHHILSVRSHNGESLSTAEIEPVQRQNTQIKVRQHRGYRNRRPEQEALEAFEWYKRSIINGDIPINHDQVRAFATGVGVHLDDVRKRSSYSWAKKKYILEAMRQWGRFVPKKYRKMTIGEFARQQEVQNVVESIAPRSRYRLTG